MMERSTKFQFRGFQRKGPPRYAPHTPRDLTRPTPLCRVCAVRARRFVLTEFVQTRLHKLSYEAGIAVAAPAAGAASVPAGLLFTTAARAAATSSVKWTGTFRISAM